MKFAHDFKEKLRREDFPSHWVDRAVPYGQLKKVLKNVAKELRELGLDPETLRHLLEPAADSELAAKYRLDAAGNSKYLRPRLTVTVLTHNGNAVDASLTPFSRALIERIAALQSSSPEPVLEANRQLLSESQSSTDVSASSPLSPASVESPIEAGTADRSLPASDEQYDRIEVPLTFDNKFFEILQSDVNRLDSLQAQEEKAMVSQIVALGQHVSHLTKPSRLSKSDLARWRAIFELYLDAQVFFSTHEQDHGCRDSQAAAKQLQWFQAEEINQTAVYKILKKFDKRTCLGVSKTFPIQVHSDKLLAGSVAKDICAQMSTDLVSVVPQINDYLCPVCFSIAYRPVRLACQHVFCIRCVVKIQRRNEKQCPLCRADTVMRASADNLDIQLEKYMRKYFPKEAKEKQRANEIERGIEDYGPEYVHSECSVM
ncbi:Transcriptional regulator of form adherence 3 [Colletotrichum orbiculare MAFF 240422]|uniref:Transcriptional regulator of form adherence 3 n=1 Tax=Colletotrichum orbiculare (strain 104-T / ATCC 96160 / CBS 514.97 / LARS 414 / MAFF 240422) TaxID=1213857 RepID=A0A484FP61_COLOR|nr:Transcriptional regulator of form adherence 3 [Colletotrichum orbiculare MAFF 240422]